MEAAELSSWAEGFPARPPLWGQDREEQRAGPWPHCDPGAPAHGIKATVLTHIQILPETSEQSPILVAPGLPRDQHALGKLKQSDSRAPFLSTESEYLRETPQSDVFQPHS